MATEPTKRATAGVAAKVDRGGGKPALLVPTPAQLARGERVLDADPSDYPQAVRLAVDKARKAGFAVRVTYSHFQDVPAVSGKHKGEWVETMSMCVRLVRGEGDFATRAWGCWLGTEDGWKYDSGQWWAPFIPRIVNVSATGFIGLITGAMVIGYDVGTGRYCAEKIAEKGKQPDLVRG